MLQSASACMYLLVQVIGNNCLCLKSVIGLAVIII